MQVKVEDLEGKALNWAVAEAEGLKSQTWHPGSITVLFPGAPRAVPWDPATNWTQGGTYVDRLIEEGFLIQKADYDLGVKCFRLHEGLMEFSYGPTPLIATLRRHVANRLGPVIDVPDELVTKRSATPRP